MYRINATIRAIFFDLWDTLVISSSSDESILKWYKFVTNQDSITFNREDCMKIQKEDPENFLEEFLTKVNDSYCMRFLLSIKNRNSLNRDFFIDSFKKMVAKDVSTIRWRSGAINVLTELRNNFIVVGVSNLWAYQKPYLKQNLNVNEYFHYTFFSSDHALVKKDLIKKAMNQLNLKPEEILVIGDRYDNDIIPSVEWGMRALKVNVGEPISPKDLLKEIGSAIGPMNENRFSIDIKNKDIKSCLFIISPYYKMFNSHNNRINLGITTLVELCERAGIFASIYHSDSNNSETYPSRFQILLNSLNFYDNLENHHVYEEITDYIRTNKPDTVVITCGDMLNAYTDTGNWQVSLRTAQAVRIGNPETYIIAYGPECGRPLGDFDAIITEEVEIDFLNILKKRQRGFIKTRLVPEDELSRYHLFKKEKFVQDISPKGFDIVNWRRGCIGRCSFCRVAEMNNGEERFRPMEKFLEDISYRYNELGLRNLYFVDPNFTSQKEKVKMICKKLENQFSDISWRTESRFDTLTQEIIPFLKSAGCNYLKLGLENALGEDHQIPEKKISLAKVREKIKMLHDHGLKCIVYLMLGGRWYNSYDYEYMYENIVELGADGYTVSILAPYIGTGMGISQEEWDRWKFTGSHLDIRLIDYWKIPIHIIEKFYALELGKGREDKEIRDFREASILRV